jgi:replicative DNA helicase
VREQGLSPLIEISQSGEGVHVWLRHEQPISGGLVRQWWQAQLAAARVQCREVFPKQSESKGGLGNLIRYPLWNHSQFVDDQRQPLDADTVLQAWPAVPAQVFGEVALAEAKDDLAGIGLTRRIRQVLASGLARQRWDGDATGLGDPSRSAIAQSLACLLVRAYIPTSEIESAIRTWTERSGATDKASRDSWVQQTVAKAYDFVAQRQEAGSQAIETLCDCALQYVAQSQHGARTHCATGMASLDAAFEGLAFGELGLVAARPSHGKTAFVLQWAEQQAAGSVPVVLISEEMGSFALGRRIASRVLRTDDVSILAAPEIPERIRAHFAEAAPIYVRHACHSIERVNEVVEQHVAQDGVRACVIDYTQLLRSRMRGTRHEEIAEVSIALRQLATRLNIAVLAAAQLNREPEKRGPGQPVRLADLGDSGQLERDADLVLALRWPWKDNPDHEPKSEFWVSVLKRRNGPINVARVKISFDDTAQTFAG